MNILLISNDPERVSFGQILKLKKQIESLRAKRVDLVSISQNGIFFNSKILERTFARNKLLSTLEEIIRKNYHVIIISLTLQYLKGLFESDPNILDLAGKFCPGASIFIFGASSIRSLLEKQDKIGVRFYHRPGVSRLTQQFKHDIINHIKALLEKES